MTGLSGECTANLTGTWHGQFTYPRYRKPVFFVATLVESAGWIEGATHEPRSVTGRMLYAAISGRRSGSAVTFVKKYQNVGVRLIGRRSEVTPFGSTGPNVS